MCIRDRAIASDNLVNVNFNTFGKGSEAVKVIETKLNTFIKSYEGGEGRTVTNAEGKEIKVKPTTRFILDNAPEIAELLPDANMALNFEGVPKTQESLGLRNVILELYKHTDQRSQSTMKQKGAGEVNITRSEAGKGTEIRLKGQLTGADILDWIGPEFLYGLDAQGNKVSATSKGVRDGRTRWQAIQNFMAKSVLAQQASEKLTPEVINKIREDYGEPGVSRALLTRFGNNIAYNIRMGVLDYNAKVPKEEYSKMSMEDRFIIDTRQGLNDLGFTPMEIQEGILEYTRARDMGGETWENYYKDNSDVANVCILYKSDAADE